MNYEYWQTLARNVEKQIVELNDLEGRIKKDKELLGDSINYEPQLEAIRIEKQKLANLLKLDHST